MNRFRVLVCVAPIGLLIQAWLLLALPSEAARTTNIFVPGIPRTYKRKLKVASP
jgi:hypothetical protein